jgi:hypothetical protein
MAENTKKAPAPAAANDTKTPRQRFTRVGVARVNSVLESIRIFKNCADRGAYEYNKAEIDKIFAKIEHDLADARNTFENALAGKSVKQIKQGFDL